MNKSDIQKAIYKIFFSFPDNKFMLPHELALNFENLTHESLESHWSQVAEILEELNDKKIIVIESMNNPVMPFRLKKGLHFDKLEAIVNPQQNNPSINIGSFNATHAQVGNQNATMNIGMTSDDLIKVLNELLAKKPEEAKTIMDKLSDMAAKGANITTLLTGLGGLL